ncbi:hypothetical protein Avbf_19087 [Armadillidium vulgare]|nr:hypothetical protein Avbf_19087 [Armadillidium vulgare]
MHICVLFVLVQSFFFKVSTAPTTSVKDDPLVHPSAISAVEKDSKDYQSPTLAVKNDLLLVNSSVINPAEKDLIDHKPPTFDAKKEHTIQPALVPIPDKEETGHPSPILAFENVLNVYHSLTTTVKKNLSGYQPSKPDDEKDAPLLLFSTPAEEYGFYQSPVLADAKDFPVSLSQTPAGEEIPIYFHPPLALMRDLPFYHSQTDEEDLPVYQPPDMKEDHPDSLSPTSVNEELPLYLYQSPAYPEFYTARTDFQKHSVTPVLPIDGIFDDFEEVKLSKNEDILSLIDKLQASLNKVLRNLKN